MRKMQTLYKQDKEHRVIPELRTSIKSYTMSVKRDGTSCMVKDNQLYKRYDANAKKGRKLPNEYVACQEEPNYNGSFPVWVKVEGHDKYHHEAFKHQENWEDGTYELCGEKINLNKENIDGHKLLKHGAEVVEGLTLDYDEIKDYLTINKIEGLIIKDEDTGIMYKVRRGDFGLVW